MQFTVNVLQRRHRQHLTWTTLGLGALTVTKRGAHPGKVQQALLDELRTRVAALKPRELEALELVRGTRLETVRMELSLRDEGRKRKLSMLCPLVVESRWASDERRFVIAYHPDAQDQWFPVRDELPLAEQAAAYFNGAWAARTDDELDALRGDGRCALKAVAFSVEVRTLLDELPKKSQGPWDDLQKDPSRGGRRGRGGYKVLSSIATDLTQRAIDGDLPVPTARARYREQLRTLLAGRERQPCVVVGPSGVGRTTLIEQLAHDLLAADDYPAHRNPDRVRHLWRLSGKRIIAGMSHLGEWEQRCLDLLDDVRRKRAVLFMEDIHQFGRIGRSRDSDRNLAEFFRGPVQRREVALVGECSAEQWQQLEDGAPAFASLFTRVNVAPSDEVETLRMMTQERRALEILHRVEITFDALRAVQELGGALVPNRANPGKSMDLLRQLAREGAGPAVEGPPRLDRGTLPKITERDVVALLSTRTGLPTELLAPQDPLPAAEIEEALSRSVIGQPEAVAAAADLVARIRTGLVDPRRPYAVYLFTGPTGTGKTELSRALASYLYGDASRLLRFDMAEYGAHDAAARLVGDRWNPEGTLTRAVMQQPFCVVLFDEVEKAHPLVHNLLLQLLEDGRLTDASGTTASFAHAVVVMTSNLGARAQAPAGFGERAAAATADHLRAVRDFFAPELFNRIDRVIPFRPLSPEVARAVAAKELAKLTRRRGLMDRNVFVSAAPAVLDLIVAEAFRSADGARSLKRHIEDVVGSELTAHLVAGERAELQLVRIHATGGAVALDVESLAEAPPCAESFPLLELLDAPVPALRARLPDALRELEAVMASPALREVSDAVSERLEAVREGGVAADPTDALYTLDALRADVLRFRDELDALARAATHAEDWDLRALELFPREEFPQRGVFGRPPSVSVFARRAIAGDVPPLRDTLLRALAQAFSLRRTIALARDPAQHAAWIHVERASFGEDATVGAPSARELFTQLRVAYAHARGELVEAAYAQEGRATPGEARLFTSLLPRAVHAVSAKVVGLCVLDFFALEHGTHIWHAPSRPPEIVRVEVHPAHPWERAGEVLQRRVDALADRDEAARRGARTPGTALPVVRTIRFEQPARAGATSPWRTEEFALGYARETTARGVTDPLPDLWQLRAARVRPG